MIDKDNSISASNEKALEEKLQAAEERCGVKFRVYVHEPSPYVMGFNAYDYHQETGESLDNLFLLVISLEDGVYYYEIMPDDTSETGITEKEIQKILDNDKVYDNIKSGKLYEGIDAFIALSEKAAAGTLRNSFKKVIIPSLIIAAVISLISSVTVVVIYRRKLHSASYPLDRYANLNLITENDVFINKTVTRVRVNNSSSSSGGGRISGGSRRR